jgi:hypothetical protein
MTRILIKVFHALGNRRDKTSKEATRSVRMETTNPIGITKSVSKMMPSSRLDMRLEVLSNLVSISISIYLFKSVLVD